MYSHKILSSVMCGGLLAAAAASGGCNRDQPKMQAGAEVQTQSAQPANSPVTVAGCLMSGEAPDTFVLTTARTEGSGEAATYQLVGTLVGKQADTLRDQVGKRIEVNGIVEAQQEIASNATARAEKDRATGTSGTPTVQTRTEIDIKRLSVSAVKALGEKCEK
jgi:hypothetical protein